VEHFGLDLREFAGEVVEDAGEFVGAFVGNEVGGLEEEVEAA